MVLDQLNDGASRLLTDLEIDEGTQRLIFLLCLPLVDGVFATLLVTGAVNTFSNMLSISLTIFAGAGALAVLFTYSDNRRNAVEMVLKSAPFLLAGALAVSLIAPMFESIFYVERVQYAAGLALFVLAGKMANLGFFHNISAATVLAAGMVVSLQNPGSISMSLEYVLPALVTAVSAIAALLLASLLVNRDLSMVHMRRGAAMVLVLIGLSLFGMDIPSELVLSVLAISFVFSLNLDSYNLNIPLIFEKTGYSDR